MIEWLSLAACLAAGLALGAFFFGGLWWTVQRGVSANQPALWFLGSKLLRMSVVLGGFYFIGGTRWERWLSCLLGFVLARLVTASLTRSRAHTLPAPAPEVSHAP